MCERSHMTYKIATSPRIVAFGDNDVDCYAEHGLMYPGGNALNVAVFARRAGAVASYIGAMSNDTAGHHMRSALQAEGVDISRLRTVPGRTAFCVIGNSNGERKFLRADLGVSIIAPEPVDLEHIAVADAIHTGWSSHVEAHLPEFAARARLSFDFADQMQPEYIARIAPFCFLASFSGGDMNDDEVAQILKQVRDAGATWCIVSRGRRGAALSGPKISTETSSVPTKVVDTLGAGDSFIARILVGLLREEELKQLLQAAAMMAADTCAQQGGFGHPAPINIDQKYALPISRIHAYAAELAAQAMQQNTTTFTPVIQHEKEEQT